MSDVSAKIRQHFEILCRTCGGGEVEVYFYRGSVHEGAGDPAYLGLRCNACGRSVEM